MESHMATEVIMPQLGESVVEGTVTKWLKNEGEPIEEFEALVEINTDKVDTEVPSPAGGSVLKLYVSEGQTVRAGTLLAVIGEPGDEIPDVSTAPKEISVEKTVAPEEPATRPVRASAPAQSRDLGFISPVVARIANEHKIDLAQVNGTGRGGRITKKDVLNYLEGRGADLVGELAPWEQPAFGELFRPTEEVFGAEPESLTSQQPSSGPAPGTIQSLDVVRRSIAEHMVRSRRTSPHVTTVMEVDLSQVVAHRQAQKESFARDGIHLTYTSYFVSAAAEALRLVPIVNSSWSDDGIHLHSQVNIGVAVSLGERGLIVPVIQEADQMSLRGLAGAVGDLSARARAKQLKPDEVHGGTFTITNHGVSGSLFATPIINQPQCAILGVGTIQKRVIVVETPHPGGGSSDVIAIRPMVYLTLTFDHRILDGVVADTFLHGMVRKLQNWA
jgi:2-oxoglutarate dehydrogenase E2 component (dihydrolipoamide succinyltransferase)